MQAMPPIFLGLGLLIGGAGDSAPGPDVGYLRELLQDRQHPRGQSQAALLLLQSTAPEAERAVRDGLQNFEEPDVFVALATAVRVSQDGRFSEDLLAAISVNRPAIRQAAAEALAIVPDRALVKRLAVLAVDAKIDDGIRQAALWTLGHSGRKSAIPPLLESLGDPRPLVRRAAADALADLTGQNLGLDAARWQAWWNRHKDLSNLSWLERRLSYQTARAHRLESDLEQMRAQALRLHQQLFGRLPVAERLAYLQATADQEDPAIRGLAVGWALEVLPTMDAAGQHALAQVILRLSHDGSPDVQRAAVLALGRFQEAAVYERLETLIRRGRPTVRAAAARSLATQARGTTKEAVARQKKVVPLLQKALDDIALDVVVEAAEDLGALGAQEAGPVLTALLHHSAEHVRQTAAQALERVAEPAVLDGLLSALDDPSVTVRFSLIGALGRAAGDGASLPEEQSRKLLGRLEALLVKDADPGVRSRAATVLGECAPPTALPLLWKGVLAGEDARVQEKAWAAVVEILARAASLPLLQEWERILTLAKQDLRRVELLTELAARWQKKPELKALAASVAEALIVAHLEQGKWATALPLVREALARTGTEMEINQRSQWLLTIGEQALKEGNRVEALKIVQEAQPYLPKNGNLAGGFEKLGKSAGEKE